MEPLDRTAWEVLNATADDFENLEQIYRQVCYTPLPEGGRTGDMGYLYRPNQGAPPLSAIADRVRTLVERGHLVVVMDEEGRPWQAGGDLSYVWRGWFRLTPEGRRALESSGHLVEQEQA